METLLSVVYVIVCLFLILVVLLQSGKGGGMGALGGGSAGGQTVFGGAGAGNFLTRLTGVCAALFMLLSVALAYLSTTGEQALDRASETGRGASATGSGATDDDGGDEPTPAPEPEPEPGPMSEVPPVELGGPAELPTGSEPGTDEPGAVD